MIAPEEGNVGGAGVRLHYLRWGAPPAPPLLLVHGSSGHAHVWDEVAEALAGDYHVVALDLRGHGESDRPHPPAYAFQDYAADLLAAVRALLPEPFVLAGHSMGALVSILLAAGGQAALRGVALLDIEANPPPHQAEHLNAAGARPPRRYASFEEALAAQRRAYPGVTETRLRALTEAMLRPVEDGALEERADRETLRRFEQVDLRPHLARIGCPTLVMRGANSTVMRRDVAEAMAASLPLGTFVEVAEAGHQLVIEQPAAVAAALRRWLAGIRGLEAASPARSG